MSRLYQKGIHLSVLSLSCGAALPSPSPPLFTALHYHAARSLHDFEPRRDSAANKSLSILLCVRLTRGGKSHHVLHSSKSFVFLWGFFFGPRVNQSQDSHEKEKNKKKDYVAQLW